MSFPKIFAGKRFNTNNVSYTNRVKSESKRHDKRSQIPTRQLYSAKKKQGHDINICLRKMTTKDGKLKKINMKMLKIMNLIKERFGEPSKKESLLSFDFQKKIFENKRYEFTEFTLVTCS